MLLRTDGALCSVRMGRIEQLVKRLPYFAVVLSQTDIELLINSFKLGMETADNHILEAVALNAQPVFHFV